MRTTIFNIVKTTLYGSDFFGSKFFFLVDYFLVSSEKTFPSQHLIKALTLDKSKSKKKARNDKVFFLFSRTNLIY